MNNVKELENVIVELAKENFQLKKLLNDAVIGNGVSFSPNVSDSKYQKPIEEMTREELVEANKLVAQNFKRKATNPDRVPMATVKEEEKLANEKVDAINSYEGMELLVERLTSDKPFMNRTGGTNYVAETHLPQSQDSKGTMNIVTTGSPF